MRQAQIYLWGLETYFQGAVPLKGAIIYYENRDTLDHIAFEVYPDPESMADLLRRVKAMLEAADAEELKRFWADGMSLKVAEALRQIGYAHVTLDLHGYQRGGADKRTAAGRKLPAES